MQVTGLITDVNGKKIYWKTSQKLGVPVAMVAYTGRSIDTDTEDYGL